MRIKIFLKKACTFLVTAVTAVTVGGCFDLGEFEDEQDYYDSFGDVRLVYQNPDAEEKDVETEDYDVRDYFYNKNTGEDFSYGDPDDDEPDEGKDIPELPYVYMAIPVEKEIRLDSLALYFYSNTQGQLQIEAYIVDELPSGGSFENVKLSGDPEYQEQLDEDGNPVLDEEGNPVLDPVSYDDPSEEKKVAQTSVYLGSGSWGSILIDRFNGRGTVDVTDSQYILLKFINNGGFKGENDAVIPFKTTNLLIRAVE